MKRMTIILCALALIGLAVWAQARTTVVVVGSGVAAGGCSTPSGNPTIVDVNSAQASDGSIEVDLGATITDNNLLLMFVAISTYSVPGNTASITGWSTLLGPVDNGYMRGYIFYKIASSETRNQTLSYTGTDLAMAAWYQISGVDTSDIEDGKSLITGSNSTTNTTASLTPTVGRTLPVTALWSDNGTVTSQSLSGVSVGWTNNETQQGSYGSLWSASKDADTNDCTTAISVTYTTAFNTNTPLLGIVLVKAAP